jgi:hypothetical protein
MSSNIQPYRHSARVEVKSKPGPLYGLVRAPKPHECATPGWWKRLWFRLTFRIVREGSGFRCHHCAKIWMFEVRRDCLVGRWDCTGGADLFWKRIGGSLEDHLLAKSTESEERQRHE